VSRGGEGWSDSPEQEETHATNRIKAVEVQGMVIVTSLLF
jgi:hypothetical protein